MKDKLLIIFSLIIDINEKTNKGVGLRYTTDEIRIFVLREKSSIYTDYDILVEPNTNLDEVISKLDNILSENIKTV